MYTTMPYIFSTPDLVVVSFVATHSYLHVILHIVPGFARGVLGGADDVVVNACRIFLDYGAVFKVTAAWPYRRVKHLERSGAAACYRALPRDVPMSIVFSMVTQPCIAYTIFASIQLRVLLDFEYTLANIVYIGWDVDVPDACPQCENDTSWAIAAPLVAVCVTCGHYYRNSLS